MASAATTPSTTPKAAHSGAQNTGPFGTQVVTVSGNETAVLPLRVHVRLPVAPPRPPEESTTLSAELRQRSRQLPPPTPPPQAPASRRRSNNRCLSLGCPLTIRTLISALQITEDTTRNLATMLWALRLSGLEDALIEFTVDTTTRSVLNTGVSIPRSFIITTTNPTTSLPFHRILDALSSVSLDALRNGTAWAYATTYLFNRLVFPYAHRHVDRMLRHPIENAPSQTATTPSSIEEPMPQYSWAFAAYTGLRFASSFGRLGTLGLAMAQLAGSAQHLVRTSGVWGNTTTFAASGNTTLSIQNRAAINIDTNPTEAGSSDTLFYMFIVFGYLSMALAAYLRLQLRRTELAEASLRRAPTIEGARVVELTDDDDKEPAPQAV
jgi:hypothetical protein